MINIKNKIPTVVENLLKLLEDSGYEAYIVGGCVRDIILGLTPKDWDITTNATPRQMRGVFKSFSIISTGEQYGTMTIMQEGTGYEITTYREDGNYSDGRRPDEVTFSNNLIEDLQRRDFTINALAYNNKNGLIDAFGGLLDLANGKIKCVGNPLDRFREDALRIMRGVRFAVRYNFEIEEETRVAMLSLIPTLKNVSMERINKELSEILVKYNIRNKAYVSPILRFVIPELNRCVGLEQHTPHQIYDVFDHMMMGVSVSPYKLIPRLTMLLHDIAKPFCFKLIGKEGVCEGHADVSCEIARRILSRLKYDNKTIKTVCNLIKYHDTDISTKENIKRVLNKIGEEDFYTLLIIKHANIEAQAQIHIFEKSEEIVKSSLLFDEIRNNKDATMVRELCIKGSDIMFILNIRPSRRVGEILEECLDIVIRGLCKNNHEDLCFYVKHAFIREE